jgi:hypothetical protein
MQKQVLWTFSGQQSFEPVMQSYCMELVSEENQGIPIEGKGLRIVMWNNKEKQTTGSSMYGGDRYVTEGTEIILPYKKQHEQPKTAIVQLEP